MEQKHWYVTRVLIYCIHFTDVDCKFTGLETILTEKIREQALNNQGPV